MQTKTLSKSLPSIRQISFKDFFKLFFKNGTDFGFLVSYI